MTETLWFLETNSDLKWWGDGEDADYRLGSMIGKHTKAHAAAVSSLSHHPTKPLLISAAYEKEMYIWNVEY